MNRYFSILLGSAYFITGTYSAALGLETVVRALRNR